MEQRDTENNGNVSNGQASNTPATQGFYTKHAAVSVIVKKTEKITTAIYMVTDFINDKEPLRIELRTLALALVSGTRKISARSTEPHYALADEIGRMAEETGAFITLAMTIGLISDMNGKIIIAELEKIKAGIDQHFGGKKVFVTTHPGYAGVVLEESFFDVPQPATILPVHDKGHKEIENVLNKNKKTIVTNTESFSSRNDLGIKIARRNDVLNVIRTKGRVSIKDIILILKDMSEKTVQRELLSLVREGALVKEGEKRWSMYRIAS